ncbi:MAG: hypothetical protein QOJ26_318, partial [Thermoplasmata archaeon]|nr:hypothetical protein [Thermoplasmata archaeon]
VPLFLLSGCLESTTSSSDTSCVNGVCENNSVTCRNGDCEVCAGDQCAPCAESECEECRDGDCPALDRAAVAAADAKPPEDFSVDESYDLTLMGLADTTWSFDVAAGASGHVYLTLSDVATGQTSLLGAACLHYEIDGARGNYVKSTEGNCSSGVGNVNVVISGNTGTADTFVRWDKLDPGHYTLTASADPQPDKLAVDIVVDNPS